MGADGNLEETLEKHVNQWLSVAVTSSISKQKADSYYWDNIFPMVKEIFKKRESLKFKDQGIYGLILTVGTSPEPLILSLTACCPERVLFLFTPETERYLDDVVRLTGLGVSRLDKQLVEGTDPLEIYEAVMISWEKWGRRKDVAVDITGGTKSMTGGLAMAGALLGFQLLYVAAGDYMKEHRRPRPGTEYLVFLPNPYTVFGILEENKAKELLRRQDYHGASRILLELSERVPDPRKVHVLYALSRAYEEWDALNLKESAKYLCEAAGLLKRLKADRFVKLLQNQALKLEHLARLMPAKSGDSVSDLLRDSAAMETLVFTIYLNASRMAGRGKYDTATLYLYRLLEVLEQRRLSVYGLDTAQPDYGNIRSVNSRLLLDKVNVIRNQVKMPPLQQLPTAISLVDGYMILDALDDPYQLSRTEPKPVHWSRFLSENQRRNFSILAHGFIFVSDNHYAGFKEVVDRLLDLFCRVEKIEKEIALKEYSFFSDLFEGEIR